MTKYSIKNICFGIGVGFIIAAIVNINTVPKKLTVDDIKREAAQYNLIVMDAKDIINKQPEPEVPEQTEVPQKEEPIVIAIESGATSEGIAELLARSGLIDNKVAFINRLSEQNKENKVQIGSFKILPGSSIDKIIEIITTLPK